MSSKRGDKDYLTDIQDALVQIQQYVQGYTFEQFVADRKNSPTLDHCQHVSFLDDVPLFDAHRAYDAGLGRFDFEFHFHRDEDHDRRVGGYRRARPGFDASHLRDER